MVHVLEVTLSKRFEFVRTVKSQEVDECGPRGEQNFFKVFVTCFDVNVSIFPVIPSYSIRGGVIETLINY